MARSMFPLANQVLHGNLAEYLTEARASRLSFEQIARDLERLGIGCSKETVRKWCHDLGIEPERKDPS